MIEVQQEIASMQHKTPGQTLQVKALGPTSSELAEHDHDNFDRTKAFSCQITDDCLGNFVELGGIQSSGSSLLPAIQGHERSQKRKADVKSQVHLSEDEDKQGAVKIRRMNKETLQDAVDQSLLEEYGDIVNFTGI